MGNRSSSSFLNTVRGLARLNLSLASALYTDRHVGNPFAGLIGENSLHFNDQNNSKNTTQNGALGQIGFVVRVLINGERSSSQTNQPLNEENVLIVSILL